MAGAGWEVKRRFKVGQRDDRHRVFIGWKLRHGEFELATDGVWYNVGGVHTDWDRMLELRTSELEKDPSLKIATVSAFRLESEARAAVRGLFDHLDVSEPQSDPAFRAAVIELLESHDICPCTSDLDDPGPEHLKSCWWADPGHDETPL